MKEKPFPQYSVNANLEGHWKFLILRGKIKQTDLILRGLLTGIWKQACIWAPDGVFKYPADQVIKQAGWQEDWGAVEDVILALKEAGFIEKGNVFMIHDWYENQPVLEKRIGSRNPNQPGQTAQAGQAGQAGNLGQSGQNVPKKVSKLVSKESSVRPTEKKSPVAKPENPYED